MNAVEPAGTGWQAALDLVFGTVAGRTVLERRAHRGPLQVQRLFYPESPACPHAYVLHPPGGVVGGDELELRVLVRGGAQALLTTPSATKLYRSSGRACRLTQRFRVSSGAELEWLPAETIAFNDARAEIVTRVQLEPGAAFIGAELLCLGRPASGERFTDGNVEQRFELWQGDVPWFVDRGRYGAGSSVLDQPWGLGGAPVSGFLVAAPVCDDAVTRVRQLAMPSDDCRFGVTALPHVVLCRVVSSSTASALHTLRAAWSALRPLVLGRQASAPRIWST